MKSNQYKELKVKGWIDVEDTEPASNVPKQCPKCGRDLHKTDALELCNMLMLTCENTKCRWAEIYEIRE